MHAVERQTAWDSAVAYLRKTGNTLQSKCQRPLTQETDTSETEVTHSLIQLVNALPIM